MLRDSLDRVRVAGWRAIAGGAGPLASTARKVNEALGRPLAPADELADRRQFAAGYAEGAPAGDGGRSAPTAAPVFVYYFKDKQWRDAAKLTEVLEANGVPYQLVNLDGDEATQAAVRRDAKGRGGPLCFIAGDCVGGRAELVNLAQGGELARRVFG